MKYLSRYRSELTLLVAIAVVLGATMFFSRGYSWTPTATGGTPLAIQNLQTLAFQASLLGIFSLGAAIVIISGGIDLSAGSMIAFCATVFACVCLALSPVRDGMPRTDDLSVGVYAVAIAAALVAALAVGTLHAWLITAVGLPPFVATLASLVGLRSLAKLIISQTTSTLENVSSSQIAIRDRSFELLSEWYVVLGIFLVLAAAIWFLLAKTVEGRHLYAVGGNEAAAELSGIRVARTKWIAYCISAVTSAIAGIVYVSYLSTVSPEQLAVGFELNAIAAAVVGGCSLAGGIGTIFGVALGALFLRVVIDAIAKLVKVGADDVEGLIVGLLVVLAVAFNELRSGSTGRGRLFAGSLGWTSIVVLSILLGGMAALMSAEGKLWKGIGVGLGVAVIGTSKAIAERRHITAA